MLERLNNLEYKINHMQVTGGAVEVTDDHIELVIDEAEAGGDTYVGYFKLNKTGADITIHDSKEATAYADATNAGLAQINNEPFTVLKDTVTATANGFVYLRATVSAGVIQAPTLVFSTTYTYTADELKLLLGRVKFADGAVTSVTQEHHGLAYGWIYTVNL